MKKFLLLTFTFYVLLSAFYFASADSLWKEGSSSPYTTARAYKVGDIIMVLIVESTSALQKAGTETGVKDDLALSFQHTLERLEPTIAKDTRINAKGENKYRGIGQTTRASNVQARVASKVTKVLPNGNLEIKGIHSVDVNGELQEVQISGTVRSKDVSIGNTVYSYQVADAKVSVKGSGPVGEAEQPGWFTRILNWLF